MNRKEIAAVLDDIALLLELRGENPFKVRAYQNGARVLESYDGDFDALVAEGRLGELKGVGEALAEKIETLHREGRLPFHEELRASTPPGLLELLEIPGLGPKKIQVLRRELGVESVAQLEAACRECRVAELAGFGAKTQANLLTGIANRAAYARRHLLWEAKPLADRIVAGLLGLPQVRQAAAAGSTRRCMETVGDLDFIVASSDPAVVMDWFVRLPGVAAVTGHGTTKSSVRFTDGLQADLRVVPEDVYPFALHHFTGSKDHNVQMRQRALARGFSLSEWGIEAKDPLLAGAAPASGTIRSEADLFAFLGLEYIPPELREGMGEIEEAERNALPELIHASDLRGAFHCHTTESDGHDTLEAMVAEADRLGWEYLGIADHSKSSIQAKGLDRDRLLRQVDAIRAINASGRHRVHVFAGTECDILPDGTLDFDDDTLAQLDYVVASVHAALNQSEEQMTARLLAAVRHPAVTMLGHMSGRLLLRREPSKVDAAAVIAECARLGTVIEFNAQPLRLDMDWRLWRKAVQSGVLASINPDAHDAAALSLIDFGVLNARKGWLEAKDVLNTRSLASVKSWLAKRKG